jgi:hypothetical protein
MPRVAASVSGCGVLNVAGYAALLVLAAYSLIDFFPVNRNLPWRFHAQSHLIVVAGNSSCNLQLFIRVNPNRPCAGNTAWVWNGNRVFLVEFVAVLMIPAATISHNLTAVQWQRDRVAEPKDRATQILLLI